ncbi:MAG: hypothetical protein ACI8PT_002409, partial [Gammaproteobacteria bacterium]
MRIFGHSRAATPYIRSITMAGPHTTVRCRPFSTVHSTVHSTLVRIGKAIALTFLALTAATSAVANTLNIARIVPGGDAVTARHQIVVSFDQPMVALGELRNDAGAPDVHIHPKVACAWRWMSPSELACQLNQSAPLRRATTYEVRVGLGITSISGDRLLVPAKHRFTTARPAVQWVSFSRWSNPTRPIFHARFSQSVSRASATAHLFLRAGDGTRHALEIRPDESAKKGATKPTPQSRAWWDLTPTRNLQANTQYTLMVEPGLLAEGGPERGNEQRPLMSVHTMPSPEYLGVNCLGPGTTPASTTRRLVRPGSNWQCDPEHAAGLVFRTPVSEAALNAHLSIRQPRTTQDAGLQWKEPSTYAAISQNYNPERPYVIWLPHNLAPSAVHEISLNASQVLDAFGRPHHGQVVQTITTGALRSRLLLRTDNAVLEAALDTDMPAQVTNLKALEIDYRRVTSAGPESGRHYRVDLPVAPDKRLNIALSARTLLDGRSGAVSGKVRTEPSTVGDSAIGLGQRFFAQVTPFQVHVKLGHFRSLVWVTSLTTGLPVNGATITLRPDTYETLGAEASRPIAQEIGAVITDSQGLAILPGSAQFDPKNKLAPTWHSGTRFDSKRLFVQVEKGQALAFVPLDQDFRVWNGGAWPSTKNRFGHLRVWGTTAQGVYRAGDSVDYKLFVRDQSNVRLVAAPTKTYGLRILGPTGKVAHQQSELSLSAYGTLHGKFTVRDDAPVGWYRFEL